MPLTNNGRDNLESIIASELKDRDFYTQALVKKFQDKRYKTIDDWLIRTIKEKIDTTFDYENCSIKEIAEVLKIAGFIHCIEKESINSKFIEWHWLEQAGNVIGKKLKLVMDIIING